MSNWLQALLFVGSSASVFWLSEPETWLKGMWLNLLIEPAWFYVAYKSKQWGVFALAFVYTYCLVTGLWHHYQ